MTTTAVETNPATSVALALHDRLSTVVLGKRDRLRTLTCAVITGGHILLNDHPGVGKTTLATAIARLVGGEFRRVQGSPDLLPTDLTGALVLDGGEWVYRPGPLLGNVILIDELNRISPRTQAALIEVMAERQISIDGIVRPLPDPYLIVATMNPSGSLGTFDLPAAQLDRFDLTLSLGAVERDVERQLLNEVAGPHRADHLEPLVPASAWAQIRAAIDRVSAGPGVVDYALDICDDLRRDAHLSVRASRSLVTLAKGSATLEGRTFVTPDDVRRLAPWALSHRLNVGRQDENEARVSLAISRTPVPA